MSVGATAGPRRHRLAHGAQRWAIRALLIPLVVGTTAAGVEHMLERRDMAHLAMPGELVDVGGRRLNIACSGTESPTVVLIPGAGETSASWGWIAPMIARDTRVCVYDRAGRGWSDATDTPQDGRALAHDLHRLLRGKGPVVMVGHSAGGLYARVHAAEYPDDVAGVVLIDATHPQMFTRVRPYRDRYDRYAMMSKTFPALARLGVGRIAYRSDFDSLPSAARAIQRALWATARHARSQRDEWAMLPTVMREAAGTSFGAIPLVVVTAGRDASAEWPALQAELARLSTNSAHRVIAGATHMSLVNTESGAAESSRAIRDVVEAVRQRRPLDAR